MKPSDPSLRPPICIVLGSNETLSRALAVAIYSVLRHLSAQREVTLYIIDGGLSLTSRRRIELLVKRVRPSAQLHFCAHSTSASYLKSCISALLPLKIEQALYFDSETLIQGNVAEVWDEGTHGCAIAATRDFAIPTIGHPLSGVTDWQERQINPQSPRFNAGVLLLNLSYWRENHLANQLASYAEASAQKPDNDEEDVLNAIFVSSWHQLEPQWNIQTSLFYLEEFPVTDGATSRFYQELGRNRPKLLRQAKILRFTGTPRPWEPGCRHPVTLQWVAELVRSQWFSAPQALTWSIPWGLKFSFLRLKLRLKLKSQREAISANLSPFPVRQYGEKKTMRNEPASIESSRSFQDNDPTISVIIPTCHRNESLAKCLDCLAPRVQTLAAERYEVIVSDDGSRLTAEAMIKERYPWAKWVAGPHKGPGANRNNGVRSARGQWIAFTDDDCLPEPQWLAAFDQQRNNSMPVLEGRTTTEPPKGIFYIAPENLNGGFLWSCNMMIEKDVFLEMDGFDDKFPHPNMEDVDLRMRLQKAGHVTKFIPEAVVFHPLRTINPLLRQIVGHESDWYMSRKHNLPLEEFQIHPILYWKSQLRQMLRRSQSPVEALKFFVTRSCPEAFLLVFLSVYWNQKYKQNTVNTNLK